MKLIKWIVDVQRIRIIPLPKFCQRGVCVCVGGGGGVDICFVLFKKKTISWNSALI